MQKKRLLLFAAALPLLWSCGDGGGAPTGQVVARVNGEEVTVSELNHEARVRGIANANDPAVRQRLLQDIIDRKLLAQSAVEQKVDRSPDYLVMRKRGEELMLSNLFVRKVVGEGAQEPSRSDIDAFIASRPTMFDRRVVFSVDQIGFPRPRDPAVMQQLAAAKTLDEIDSRLAAAGIPRERTRSNWDSARMPPQLVQRLQSLPAGEPFIQTSDPMVAGVIVESRPAPLPEQARIPLATQLLKQQRLGESVRSWLQGSRRKAEIRYQPGYAPPRPAAGGGAPAPAGSKT